MNKMLVTHGKSTKPLRSGCGQGVNGTQHDAQGNPVVNTAKFPDIGGLVKYGHDHGLSVGWYEHGCACGVRLSSVSFLFASWKSSLTLFVHLPFCRSATRSRLITREISVGLISLTLMGSSSMAVERSAT